MGLISRVSSRTYSKIFRQKNAPSFKIKLRKSSTKVTCPHTITGRRHYSSSWRCYCSKMPLKAKRTILSQKNRHFWIYWFILFWPSLHALAQVFVQIIRVCCDKNKRVQKVVFG